MQDVGSYGILQTGATAGDTTDRLVEEISVRGFAVMPQAIEADAILELSRRLDAVYAAQCNEVGGESVLLEMHDADIVRCPLAYDDIFLSLARHPAVMELLRRLLGDNFVLLMQNGIINRPERVQAQTRWHRDLNYQHWVSTAPLAVSFLVCLEDFNKDTGGTVFLPASHKFAQFPSTDLVGACEATVDAPSGSILIFDSMTFHRASINPSNRIRRGINHVVGKPILGQQVDLPTVLGRAAPDDPWLAAYLGYRWNPVQDVKNWRLRKVAQLRAAHQGASGAAPS
ncbi:MAG: phytanoyl-CoA dioxygenase family protein [Acidobacteriota bacterium]|nr:phytanoyl-CoA dioxygenase family protein [Acidobacteriota bacterium]